MKLFWLVVFGMQLAAAALILWQLWAWVGPLFAGW